jgi:Leucine-rich repeat (LRR) protein
MRTIQIGFFILFWITCASADGLQCDSNFGFSIPTSCRIGSGTVITGESINILNADPKVVTTLSLNKVTMTTLPQNIFINFPLVEVFYVSYCELSRLAINDFKNGLKLKDVFFHQTQLQVIPAQIFRLCPNIEKLTFSESPIQRIGKGAFSNLRKLKELVMSNLNLLTYPNNMLANMTALEKITMENCSLKTLPEGFFRNNWNLTKIDFNTNQLESIPDGTFDHLENLDELQLDSNNLLTLSTSKAQKLFAQNNQLQQLHISSKTQTIMVQNNFITKVTCDNDSSVLLAYFSNNSLSNFDCFRDMTKSLNVILDNNKLSKLSAKAFNSLSVLRTLTINGNPSLKATAKMFAPMTTLRNLWVDRLTTGYKNLRQQYPELSMIYLTTRSWNCSYLKQVANVLNTQRIYLRFINEYTDFVNFKCQLKMWDVSKFE